MRTGITFNLRSDIETNSRAALAEDAAEEFDLPETIASIVEVLKSDGHEVYELGGDLGVMEKIQEWRIEFVFNIAEGFRGRNREAHIPALLELLGVPYSGSDPLALALTLDKPLAKRIALSLGIATPPFWVLEDPSDLGEVPERYPLFVKPAWEGSSMGIRLSSRIKNREELLKETDRLFENYPGEPVLVEEDILGREVTVGLVGNRPPEILGMMEIAFRGQPERDFCYSLEVKRNWREWVDYRYPADLGRETGEEIRAASLRLYETLRLRDVARLDFRVNREGRPYFLEANPLPGLSPESGDLVLMAGKKGWSYRDLILKITRSALSRYPELTRSRI